MPALTPARRLALAVMAAAADQGREVRYSNSTAGWPASWPLSQPAIVHWKAADWLATQGLVEPIRGPEFVLTLTDDGRALAAQVAP